MKKAQEKLPKKQNNKAILNSIVLHFNDKRKCKCAKTQKKNVSHTIIYVSICFKYFHLFEDIFILFIPLSCIFRNKKYRTKDREIL